MTDYEKNHLRADGFLAPLGGGGFVENWEQGWGGSGLGRKSCSFLFKKSNDLSWFGAKVSRLNLTCEYREHMDQLRSRRIDYWWGASVKNSTEAFLFWWNVYIQILLSVAKNGAINKLAQLAMQLTICNGKWITHSDKPHISNSQLCSSIEHFSVFKLVILVFKPAASLFWVFIDALINASLGLWSRKGAQWQFSFQSRFYLFWSHTFLICFS